jgi:hypothetical protein
VNLVAFAPAGDYTAESWTTTATMGEFLSEFDGWDPRLIRLIQAAGTPGRRALLDRAPLRRWGLRDHCRAGRSLGHLQPARCLVEGRGMMPDARYSRMPGGGDGLATDPPGAR